LRLSQSRFDSGTPRVLLFSEKLGLGFGIGIVTFAVWFDYFAR